jgi:cytochrome P450
MDTSSTPYTMPFGEPDGLTFPPLYARIQREEPLARIRMAYGGDAWMVTRYDDVKTVLSDPRFSRAATVGADVARLIPAISHSNSVINLDPPEHTRLRKLVAKEFGARHIEQLRPRVTVITHALLDDMEKQGKPADLVRGLARPLPIQVICEVLGVPVSYHYATVADEGSQGMQAIQGFSRMHSYLTTAVAERRINPTADMLGALVQAHDDDDRLTDEELVEFGMTLLMGGFETTAAQIANFTATLFRYPDHLAELRADPALIPAAVEELLRVMPLSRAGFVRIATEDVELSGGTVGKGETILPYIHTANRDPEVFERPDELDFHRRRNPHLVFGFGPHHCIGAQLARMELQVALSTLLTRFPGLECAIEPERIEYPKEKMVRGPETLPVTW